MASLYVRRITQSVIVAHGGGFFCYGETIVLHKIIVYFIITGHNII